MVGLDLFKSLLNRFIAVEIDFQRLHDVGGVRTLLLEGLDRSFGLLECTATDKNVVGFVGLHQGLDGLIPNTAVGACDLLT